MTVYYVDDGGSATDPYDTWAKAATSLSALDDAKALASGDIVYIGHNHVCQYTHATHRDITGPSSGLPCVIISATQGSNPPTYQKSSTNQVDTSEGAYYCALNGSFALYGVRIKAGGSVVFAPNGSRSFLAESCEFAPGAGSAIDLQSAYGLYRLRKCTADLTADGTTNRTAYVFALGFSAYSILGTTFVNPGYRTTAIIGTDVMTAFEFGGSDLSGFQSGCEVVGQLGPADGVVRNCVLASGQAIAGFSSAGASTNLMAVNCGTAYAPAFLNHQSYYGKAESSASIYRTGGAEVEETPCAWLITTTSAASEYSPYYTPWMYGLIDATGSTTFDCYITNDTADFTDAQAWMEVELLGTASEAISTLATDQRADITTTAANQTDDVTSTWNGSGPSFTYKQKLSVTATVNQVGMYRARVAVGLASIAGSRFFYVDPKIAVS